MPCYEVCGWSGQNKFPCSQTGLSVRWTSFVWAQLSQMKHQFLTLCFAWKICQLGVYLVQFSLPVVQWRFELVRDPGLKSACGIFMKTSSHFVQIQLRERLFQCAFSHLLWYFSGNSAFFFLLWNFACWWNIRCNNTRLVRGNFSVGLNRNTEVVCVELFCLC